MGDESARARIVDELKALAQGEPENSTAQLAAAQVLLQENQVSAAYQCVAGGTSMEHMAMKLQILLKIDRYDLAKSLAQQMRVIDEDSIVAQLCSIYVHLANGRSGAADAEHTLNMLSEQYGPSTFLLNLTACALLSGGDYVGAESKLQECINDHIETASADTLVNLVTSYVHQNKMTQAYQTVQELQMKYPNHPYHAGLDRITSAFDRDAIKYKA
jgi:coatomer subunit epsilon